MLHEPAMIISPKPCKVPDTGAQVGLVCLIQIIVLTGSLLPCGRILGFPALQLDMPDCYLIHQSQYERTNQTIQFVPASLPLIGDDRELMCFIYLFPVFLLLNKKMKEH